ncbi:MAG: hypothetical protein NTW01_09340 [Gammaproteobacteria bacterium]|nr:hypothetical protein [Gammaproteobacteria bacterium]
MSGPGALGLHSRNIGLVEFPSGIASEDLLSEADIAGLASSQHRRAIEAAVGVDNPVLPGNSGFAVGLLMAGRALDRLDQARCLVVGIEVGFQSATIRLARPPSAVLNLREERACHTGPRGDRIHVMRTHFMGVTLEWREAPPL